MDLQAKHDDKQLETKLTSGSGGEERSGAAMATVVWENGNSKFKTNTAKTTAIANSQACQKILYRKKGKMTCQMKQGCQFEGGGKREILNL